jgi:hypothetical protein
MWLPPRGGLRGGIARKNSRNVVPYCKYAFYSSTLAIFVLAKQAIQRFVLILRFYPENIRTELAVVARQGIFSEFGILLAPM